MPIPIRTEIVDLPVVRKGGWMSRFTTLLEEINRLSDKAQSDLELQQAIVQAVARNLAHYNWIGFYMLDPEDASMLVLGPFHGEPTQHTHIRVTQGICGAAVARNETVVVKDVASDPRYLSCSVDTKSEIVTPIRVRGRVVGEIDVDSNVVNAFQTEDREFLERCANIVGRYIEQIPQPALVEPPITRKSHPDTTPERMADREEGSESRDLRGQIRN